MEKFFIVTKESSLNKEYLEYQNNVKEVNEYVKKFMEAEGIESKEYSLSENKFYIVPTSNDLEKFNKVLSKPLDNGLRAFKGNSKISKAWERYLESNKFKILHKPYVGVYFRGFGTCKYRLFNIGDVLYCSFECDYDFSSPTGFIEIKASEFYRAIEEHNEKIENDKAS